MMLDELISMFLSSRKRGVDGAKRQCRPKTLEVYERNLGVFRTSMAEAGILKLSSIRKVNVTTFFDAVITKVEGGEWSLSTAYQLYRSLKSFFRWVSEDEDCQIADLDKMTPMLLRCIPAVGEPPARTNIPEAKDIKKFKNSFNVDDKWEYRDYVLTCLMVDTGLRAGEAANLQVQDVKFEEGRIFTTGKTGPRTVNVTNDMLRLLKGWLRKRQTCRYAAESPFVFVSKRSPKLDVGAIGHGFRKHCAKHGLPTIHPHLLRHAFATNYLKNGGNMENLRLQMGHTRYNMLQKYLDLAKQGSREARKEHERVSLLKEV